MDLVDPRTFFLGATEVDRDGLAEYLTYTGQESFLEEFDVAVAEGVHSGLALCSFFAKLCYAALTTEKNENISRVRSIPDNIAGTIDHAHFSVFEHCFLNFVTTDCSRVFTHELVRHRVGTAFSQTSGRYVRTDRLRMVLDPILEPVAEEGIEAMNALKKFYAAAEAKLGLLDEGGDFAKKKKLTSALRRFLPNGQANEIGWSVNLRSIRHFVLMRTSRHAEWEIRLVANQVYEALKERFPLMWEGAKEEEVDGLIEVSGLRMQPYETVGDN